MDGFVADSPGHPIFVIDINIVIYKFLGSVNFCNTFVKMSPDLTNYASMVVNKANKYMKRLNSIG